jgi:hypothetical protein
MSPSAGSSGEGSPNNQSAFIQGSATNETEKLLDIDGLLEIVKLIGRIKEDGRLESIDGESSDHVDE